ncbi:MAG TPA: cytidylate kinase-like family protein [Verrucomicrobiae bacterium]|nr:cytidylate kinase-like family protein [Verrucomicrobiae bacterium]
MNAGLENCWAFVNAQAAPGERTGAKTQGAGARAVTISREAGCGALVVAEKLASYLQKNSSKDPVPWTVFDRNLMDRVLEDHYLPTYLSKFLPEDRVSRAEDFITDLLGSQPPLWKVVRQSVETILNLAELGRVIIIGRGSSVITSQLPRVLHVRLVAPLENRVEHAYEAYGMTKAAARKFCRREDRGRARYMKKYFRTDVTDPMNYHMVINTGLVGYDEAARLIGEAALNLRAVSKLES